MRRLALVSAVALLAAVPTASRATQSAPGDGCLVVQDGRGIVSINAKGYVFGRFQQGQVTITDPIAGDGTSPRVYGYEKARTIGERTTLYIGNDVRFRMSGRYIVRVYANSGIDVSAVGRGTARLSSDDFIDAGSFSVDPESFCDDGFQLMPDVPTTYDLETPSTS